MSNLKLNENATIENNLNVLPKAGQIIPFAGPATAVPTGWLLCDGTKGTPNLRGKYIAGWSTNLSAGQTFGSLAHTHSTNLSFSFTNTPTTMGSHSHNWNSGYGATNAGHTHNWGGSRNGGLGNDASANRVSGTQANVLQNGHSHAANSIGIATITRNDGASARHGHALNATGFGASVENANHTHTPSANSVTVNTSATVNPLPATYFVNFIVKV